MATFRGAVNPRRTWLPFAPSTVTVTSSPIITDSPRRLVRMSIACLPCDFDPPLRLEWSAHRDDHPSRQARILAPLLWCALRRCGKLLLVTNHSVFVDGAVHNRVTQPANQWRVE